MAKARYASNRACYVVNNGNNMLITGGQKIVRRYPMGPYGCVVRPTEAVCNTSI